MSNEYFAASDYCPVCDGKTRKKFETYSGRHQITRYPLKITTYVLICDRCQFQWLPIEEEKRIDRLLGKNGK